MIADEQIRETAVRSLHLSYKRRVGESMTRKSNSSEFDSSSRQTHRPPQPSRHGCRPVKRQRIGRSARNAEAFWRVRKLLVAGGQLGDFAEVNRRAALRYREPATSRRELRADYTGQMISDVGFLKWFHRLVVEKFLKHDFPG